MDILALFLIGMFVLMIIGLLSGHPLAFVLGGVATIVGVMGWGDTSVINMFVIRTFDLMNNYGLVAIPLFILMANFLTASKVADGLFEAAYYLLGPIKGGLALTVIVVSTIFAATTGIVGASVVTMGMLGLPVLLRKGYSKELSAGVICAGGSLGILIPPSIMLVVMGTYAQLSVGKLFLVAIVPGLLLSLCYMIYVVIVCNLRPEMGPALTAEEAAAMPVPARIKNAVINLVPPLLLILAVLGSIFGGIATPTEASGMGATMAFLMTVGYRRFNLQVLRDSVVDTAKTTAMCFAILMGANAFTSVFVSLDGDVLVQEAVLNAGLGKLGALLVMLAIVFVLGCFIDWIGIVMLVFPIFLPIMDAFGYDRLFIVGLNAVLLQTCFITPPFGYALFYIKGIAPEGMTLQHIYRGIIPFVLIIVFVVGLIMVFPDIMMYLPNNSGSQL